MGLLHRGTSWVAFALVVATPSRSVLSERPHDSERRVEALPAVVSKLLREVQVADGAAGTAEKQTRRCATELDAARKALEKAKTGIKEASAQVASGKQNLRDAVARRAVLHVHILLGKRNVSGGVRVEQVVASIQRKIEHGDDEVGKERAQVAKVLESLKHRKPSQREIAGVEKKFAALEAREAAWRLDKEALSRAARAPPADIETEQEELRDLDNLVIPSAKSSVATHEEVVASMVAATNATHSRLQACLNHASAQAVARGLRSRALTPTGNLTVAVTHAAASNTSFHAATKLAASSHRAKNTSNATARLASAPKKVELAGGGGTTKTKPGMKVDGGTGEADQDEITVDSLEAEAEEESEDSVAERSSPAQDVHTGAQGEQAQAQSAVQPVAGRAASQNSMAKGPASGGGSGEVDQEETTVDSLEAEVEQESENGLSGVGRSGEGGGGQRATASSGAVNGSGTAAGPAANRTRIAEAATLAAALAAPPRVSAALEGLRAAARQVTRLHTPSRSFAGQVSGLAAVPRR